MWSVVEKTALAEAEVEYHETHVSDDDLRRRSRITRRRCDGDLAAAPPSSSGRRRPGRSRATARSPIRRRSPTASTEVTAGGRRTTGPRSATATSWPTSSRPSVFAGRQGRGLRARARRRRRPSSRGLTLRHPLAGHGRGYDFDVPLLAGDHVTDDAGTGFVHTAPGHGRDDFEIWMANGRALAARGIETRIPYTVDATALYTEDAPGLRGRARPHRQGREGRRQRGASSRR